MAWVLYRRILTHAVSGLRYKELGLKDNLPGMSGEKQFAFLASDGMLVKRPILVGNSIVLIGFREAEWNAVLGLITSTEE